eukprot:jgi/Chlat1/5708/Chrsp38S09023
MTCTAAAAAATVVALHRSSACLRSSATPSPAKAPARSRCGKLAAPPVAQTRRTSLVAAATAATDVGRMQPEAEKVSDDSHNDVGITLESDAKREVVATEAQLEACKRAIEAHMKEVRAHPHFRGEKSVPTYRFHPAGTAVHGTCLLFHGYAATVHQFRVLTDFLFKAGFNVYSCEIAGHTCVEAAETWPLTALQPDIFLRLEQKVKADEVLLKFFRELKEAKSAGKHYEAPKPGIIGTLDLLRRFATLDSELPAIIKAIESNGDPNFDKYFESTHLRYLTEAEDRLREVDAMPGPIYTLGLSVGGAVALALAQSHPERVKRVVAYAPLLRVHGSAEDHIVALLGPLNISESGWDPELQFPLGCFTAARAFGGFVRTPERTEVLKKVPTLFVLTENEDAACVDTNRDVSTALGDETDKHFLHVFSAAQMVPHPMIDPAEVSQDMKNFYWQSLYQETYRFLVKEEFDAANMRTLQQDLSGGVPYVPLSF